MTTTMRAPARAAATTKTATTEPSRPKHHNGVLVIDEELIMNLPNAPFRYSRLHLEDGAVAFACRDCVTTTDTRGEVMSHRNEAHGVNLGRKPLRVKLPALSAHEAPDLVLAARPDGSPAPDDPMRWTIGELLALLPSIKAFGDLVDSQEQKVQEAIEVLDEYADNQGRLQAYSDLMEELKAARALLREQSNYAELKKELHQLRNWKRRMKTQMKNIGFQLVEED